MHLDLISPTALELAQAHGDLLTLPLFDNDLPPRGPAGQVDFWMHCKLSHLLAGGESATGMTFRAAMGQAILVPGKPSVNYPWVLLFGLGPPKGWNQDRFRLSMDYLMPRIAKLAVEDLTMVLPPWKPAGMTCKATVELLLKLCRGRQANVCSRLCIVEDSEFHAEMFDVAASYQPNLLSGAH